MAKLQDALEVFMEELEKVQASIDSIKEINPTIDSKINEIKKLALKVEIRNLESANQLFLKNLENQYLKIDEKTNQHLKNFEKMMQKEKNYFNRYYKIGISFLVVFLLSITLSVKFYYQSQDYRKDYLFEQSKNRVLSDFIDEKNLKKSFEKWIDKKHQETK